MSVHTPAGRRALYGAIAATTLLTPLLAAPPAQAGGCDDPGQLSCNITVHEPGSPGGGGGGTGGGSGGGDSGPVIAPDPVGLNPNEGAGFVQVPGNQPPPQAAVPATADLVASAMDTAAFPVPTVHTAPKGKTYVRLNTSLWVDGFHVVKTDPITKGNQTVQATATPASVTWNLGETTKTCDNAGSENGKACTYIYKRSSAAAPGGSYKITATIVWHVAWTCVGADCDGPGGDLAPHPATSPPTPLVVGEIQTTTGQ
ncbi:hypothetical protein [Actinomadura opuntiae]|uniref:hypothetical protein n=1 Tax=Actinomadura sp. OS1-43 TaxID=604315 RepID=UPI00255B3DDA|nr:hypothetical protein [Actinomadura sp. OS1-43]MDL4817630.1 hypothetical protein [Actinomadura sp. OS1-43]